MAALQVRYILHNVDEAISFYTKRLNFKLEMHPAPAFAMLSYGDLRLVLSAPDPSAGGGQQMPGGTQQTPGGWNRFALQVTDIVTMANELKKNGVHFRSDIVNGAGGKQVIMDDPSGNPIELFEPILDEAKLDSTKT